MLMRKKEKYLDGGQSVDAVGGGGDGRVGERGVERAMYRGGENRKPRS